MKKITLLRHAKSDWDNPDLSDIERSLNQRGRNNAPMMGERLRARDCIPDFVLCSTATRTQETANLVLPGMGIDSNVTPFKLDARIYEASVSMLFSAIADVPENAAHLLVIGHNPGLAMLGNTFVPGAITKMPSCAVSSFAIDCDDWQVVRDYPAKLLFHDFPKNTIQE